jgi:polyisoprenoid-binding protein YceI
MTRLFFALSMACTFLMAFKPKEKVLFKCENGSVTFKSDAPLELIQASSNKLRGVIDPANNSFAWAVDVRSFDGFNGHLQRDHFNENYLESENFPRLTFTGKIIESIDYQKDGVYTVRAKGKLFIHGKEQERIIKSQMEIKKGILKIKASFDVPLTDHNISIPKIVNQKIAEEINVTVSAELK